MHPMLREGVTMGVFRYKGCSAKHYYIENKNEEQFEVSCNVLREVSHADGTHPLRISRRLQNQLEEAGILSTRRYEFGGFISRFILFPIGENAGKHRSVCSLLNAILPILAPVLFAAAVLVKRHCGSAGIGDLQFVPYYLLILLSLGLHECAHLTAGISYGCRCTDMGLLLFGILPVGAYVGYYVGEETVSDPERMQLSLAGVEANILIAAVFLFLSVMGTSMDKTFAMAANINVALALLNLLPVSGLDGESALSALCGVTSISEVAKRCLRSRKHRKKLLHSGMPGIICLCIFSFTLLSKGIFWLVVGLDVLSVLFMFL